GRALWGGRDGRDQLNAEHCGRRRRNGAERRRREPAFPVHDQAQRDADGRDGAGVAVVCIRPPRRRSRRSTEVTDDDPAQEDVRLDVWLDVACLFKTRSEAQKALRAGKVSANGQSAKPNRRLRVRDDPEISRPFGRKQRVRVLKLAAHHVARAEARLLYEDLTPAPTPDEIEARRLERMYRAAMTPPRAPDKRQRRALRRLKGKI